MTQFIALIVQATNVVFFLSCLVALPGFIPALLFQPAYIRILLMRILWGPNESVLTRGVSLFHAGVVYICKMRSGPHTVYVLSWMSVFHRSLQGGVPLYSFHSHPHIYFFAQKFHRDIHVNANSNNFTKLTILRATK